jgi:hypothetical protein
MGNLAVLSRDRIGANVWTPAFLSRPKGSAGKQSEDSLDDSIMVQVESVQSAKPRQTATAMNQKRVGTHRIIASNWQTSNRLTEPIDASSGNSFFMPRYLLEASRLHGRLSMPTMDEISISAGWPRMVPSATCHPCDTRLSTFNGTARQPSHLACTNPPPALRAVVRCSQVPRWGQTK